MGGLAQHASLIHPGVLAEVETWRGDHPLGKLRAALDGHRTLPKFLDAWAEAAVARHLLARECSLRMEVETPSRRACDFEVESSGRTFYLHVKRLDTERAAQKRLVISSRLRNLERIERPYVVGVRWREGAGDGEMQRIVREASDFLRHARVGDELLVRDDGGRAIGGVLVIAPWDGPHVSLVIGLPTGFIDEAKRLRRLLHRAHLQFMPRALNVILITSSRSSDWEEFESALLGSHVERWDAFPPRGRRIAHGRAHDGFWNGRRAAESRIAGWFRLAPEEAALDVRIIEREEPLPLPDDRALVGRLFERTA